MKVKKQKRHHKIVRFYTICFGFREPFKILCDGTFIHHLLINQIISAGHAISNTLGGQIKLFTTRCVISELESLGASYSGSLQAANDLVTARCDHEKRISAARCIEEVIGNDNSEHFFVATQNTNLRKKFQAVSGVPVIFGLGNTLFLDPPSESLRQHAIMMEEERLDHVTGAEIKLLEKMGNSKLATKITVTPDTLEGSENEVLMARMHAKRYSRMGVNGVDKPRFKKKKAKGANPLSCKKKKKQGNSSSASKQALVRPDPTRLGTNHVPLDHSFKGLTTEQLTARYGSGTVTIRPIAQGATCELHEQMVSWRHLCFGLTFPLDDLVGPILSEWGLHPCELYPLFYAAATRARTLQSVFGYRFGSKELKQCIKAIVKRDNLDLLSVRMKYFTCKVKSWSKWSNEPLFAFSGPWCTYAGVPSTVPVRQGKFEFATDGMDDVTAGNLVFWTGLGAPDLFDLRYPDTIVPYIRSTSLAYIPRGPILFFDINSTAMAEDTDADAFTQYRGPHLGRGKQCLEHSEVPQHISPSVTTPTAGLAPETCVSPEVDDLNGDEDDTYETHVSPTPDFVADLSDDVGASPETPMETSHVHAARDPDSTVAFVPPHIRRPSWRPVAPPEMAQVAHGISEILGAAESFARRYDRNMKSREQIINDLTEDMIRHRRQYDHNLDVTSHRLRDAEDRLHQYQMELDAIRPQLRQTENILAKAPSVATFESIEQENTQLRYQLLVRDQTLSSVVCDKHEIHQRYHRLLHYLEGNGTSIPEEFRLR